MAAVLLILHADLAGKHGFDLNTEGGEVHGEVRSFPQQAATAGAKSRYCAGGAGVAGIDAAGSPAPVFTRSFSSLLGLKNGIFLAGTSTRSPVLGLRPTRGFRWRVRKLPKPRISILSPARSERTTLSKIVSTITSLSLRVSSAKRETSSIRSALVITPRGSSESS